MSLRRYTPPSQTGRGLRGVLMSTGQEIVQDGLNESHEALGGYDQVVRRTTDAFKKAAKRTLKCKAGKALTTSKRKVRDLFGWAMQPIPTRPRKRRAQGGLTRSGAYPPSLFFQRGGLVLPLPDSVRDRITPPVWRMRGRGQRGGLLLPLPPQLRGRMGTPLGMTSALLREMAHPTNCAAISICGDMSISLSKNCPQNCAKMLTSRHLLEGHCGPTATATSLSPTCNKGSDQTV